MVLREFYEGILNNFTEDANQEIQSNNSPQLNAVILMEAIINAVQDILNIENGFVKTDEYTLGGRNRNTINTVFTNFKRYLRQYTDLIPSNAQARTVIKQFTQDTNLRDKTIKSIIFSYLLENPDIYNLENLNIEGREVRTYDEAMSAEENLGPAEFKEEPGMRDLFTNSELIQDNITQLNIYIDKINEQLYKILRTGITDVFFDPTKIIPNTETVEQLFNRLLQLAGGDKKLISDKYDIIVYFLSGNASNTVNPSADMDSYFKSGIFPLKKVNVSDLNKPTKNANLITGTQNIYKVENTQNPFKISPYVNNDLGDYVVNGKKINIKLVGLNYIVKEGSKTKVFKNLSHAKQFIYNGGFDMYNNNKSKFISNVSKDFNNKKQPLRLSYSSNIF